MNILVIGAGAIGCMLATRLTQSGHQVTLVGRPHTVSQIAANDLRLVEADGRISTAKVTVCAGIVEAFRATKGYDLAIVAVKAFHTQTVAQDLCELWQDPAPVLTVQNGVGNEETLAQWLAPSPILAGALTTPVEVIEPGHVRIARPSYHFGIASGPHAESTSPAASVFQESGFKVVIVEDYRALKWSKLLLNILANAQSAILRYTPAQIFASTDLGNLEIRAWREALSVMRELRIHPVALGGYPLPIVGPLIRHLPLNVVRPVMRRFIIGGRGTKMPSLFFDVYPRVRPQSEIGWLNGAVVTAAREVGIRVPVNEVFTETLSDIMAQRELPADWAGQPQRLLSAIARSER